MDLGAAEFEQIAKLAYSESGLQLVAEKTSMIQSRLRHRLKALGISDFRTYTDFVCSTQGLEERRQMISALTTNVSHFYREQHHFEILEKAAKEVFAERLFSGHPMRIWSAGCSNGQEAVSIAMTMTNIIPDISKYDFKILATDIDPNVVQFAKNGTYPERLMGGVPNAEKNKYFNSLNAPGETSYTVKQGIRQLTTFKELNLLTDWPMKMQMDFIFCRNVVIYFDLKTQNALWPRFRSQLKSNGYFFLGHSERVANPENVGFESSGPTTYRPVET